jgi:Protein of unknown function (DUF1570)
MSCSGLLVVLSLSVLQVPPPSLEVSRELEAARRTIAAREVSESNALAQRLDQQGETEAARQVRQRLPRAVAPDGATRIVPLPEVVAPASDSASPAGAWQANLKEIQSRAAADLFGLAQRAAKSEPPRYGLSSQCLRAVIERQPDHREARRLLGYVPYQGGWAKPFAVDNLQKKGNVNHPIFGWVPADWVPHLDKGELPAPTTRRQEKARWLSAEAADRLRAEWNPPWRISTEHFEIQTNVPLAETIRFGRRLEAFHDLFMTLMADVLVEKLPLVRRFKEPAMTGEPPSKLHLVSYFATRDEYIDSLSARYGQKIAGSLGFYDPPKPGKGGRSPAYSFRDPNGQIPVVATLYHEVSHQLLFETSGLNAYNKNVGNYWVFEGLGTYFETVSPQADGSLEVGGFVGVRIEEAIKSLAGKGRAIPLDEFVALGEDAFMRDDPGIYLRYQEAMALAVFLMQWHDGTYRDAFLDYIRDAYRGRIKGTARKLDDRLGQPYSTLDAQFLTFLKGGLTRQREAEPAVAQPIPGNSIRTVPSQ